MCRRRFFNLNRCHRCFFMCRFPKRRQRLIKRWRGAPGPSHSSCDVSIYYLSFASVLFFSRPSLLFPTTLILHTHTGLCHQECQASKQSQQHRSCLPAPSLHTSSLSGTCLTESRPTTCTRYSLATAPSPTYALARQKTPEELHMSCTGGRGMRGKPWRR